MQTGTDQANFSMNAYDAILIGGGHNGLVCAAYLSKAGLRTLVVEQQEVVGGACITKPLFPDCRVSVGACWSGMLRPKIIADLNLFEHGLDTYPMDPQVLALYPDGRHLFIWLDDAKADLEVASFTRANAATEIDGLHKFNEYSDKVLEVISPLLLSPPLSTGHIAQRFADAGIPSLYHEVFEWSVAEVVSKFVKDEALKALLAFGAISISNTSPFTTRTAFDLFYMMTAETQGFKKAWGFARGGMGSITAALARAASSFGAEIRTKCEVKSILVEEGKAVGIVLQDGSKLHGRVIVSNADPKRTFLNLLPADILNHAFQEQVRRIHMAGSNSMVHFLLNGLPHFRGFENEEGDQHRGMIVIAPSLNYIDAAWRDGRAGKISTSPILTMSLQSVTDNSIAPVGKHVLSVFVQFTPYTLAQGSWDEAKQELVQKVVNTIEPYAPNIRDNILDFAVLTPSDIEKGVGITGGHAEHGDMISEQLFQNRPLPGWANYRTPVRNLYLCGSGTHPGGTVTGAPGFNAAYAILNNLNF